MPITSEQHAELSKPDAVRIVTSGIPVQVTIADNAVKVRGIFSDVRDALALLKRVVHILKYVALSICTLLSNLVTFHFLLAIQPIGFLGASMTFLGGFG